MKTFRVGVREVHYNYIKVEAENEDEAKEKVNDHFQEGAETSLVYSHTDDLNTWTVEDITEEAALDKLD